MVKLKKHNYQIYNPEIGLGIVFDNVNYVINTMDLGNIEANLSFYAGAGQFGKTITNRVLGPREIFIGGYIISDTDGEMSLLKHRLESVILPITDFQIIVDNKYKLTCAAYSTLEYSASWFENNQMICKFELEAVCAKPFFESLSAANAEITSWIKDFHFPFTVKAGERFIFGHRNPSKVCTVKNLGDVPTGIQVSFKAINGTVVDPWIKQVNSNEIIKLNTTIGSGEEVVVDTSYANKMITNITTGENLLATLSLDSSFIQMPRGTSHFIFGQEGSSTGTLQCYIHYVPQLVVV